MSFLTDEATTRRAQRHASSRLSNVSSRLTRDETEQLDALAQKHGQQRGEFIRRLILEALAREGGATDTGRVLTEIVGVQLLLMNALKPIATGQPLTSAAFDSIVAEVHKIKKSVARKLSQEQ